MPEHVALHLLRMMRSSPGDLFHANTIVSLKAHPSGVWKDGDLMVSLRTHDLVFVFDPADYTVRWMWGPGKVFGQHEPSVLANGDVLMLDNGAPRGAPGPRGSSKVVEMDPTSGEIVWEYQADPPTSFYSEAEGGCQLLPNGNILVAEYDGRAFEITRDKKIVWEYFNPRLDKTGSKRSGMYQMERIPPEVVEPLLSRARNAQ